MLEKVKRSRFDWPSHLILRSNIFERSDGFGFCVTKCEPPRRGRRDRTTPRAVRLCFCCAGKCGNCMSITVRRGHSQSIPSRRAEDLAGPRFCIDRVVVTLYRTKVDALHSAAPGMGRGWIRLESAGVDDGPQPRPPSSGEEFGRISLINRITRSLLVGFLIMGLASHPQLHTLHGSLHQRESTIWADLVTKSYLYVPIGLIRMGLIDVIRSPL